MKPTSADPIPLTPLQQGMVYYHLREGRHSGVDVVQVEVGLPEAVDVPALRDAWRRVVSAEPQLRTVARWSEGGEPHGVILPSVEVPFEVVEVEASDPREAERRFGEALHEDEIRGFALDEGPLCRLALYRFGPKHHRLVWTLHHLVADGWSYALVLGDVFRLYDGEAAQVPARPPFRRYVEHLRTRSGEGDREFWEEHLGGSGAPDRLPGRSDATRAAGRPGPRRYLHETVDGERTDRLRRTAREWGATLNTMIQAAWALTLSRWGQGADVTFGAIRGGRGGGVPGAGEMVGLFIQPLPLRVRIGDHDRLEALVRAVRSDWTRMRDHAGASISDIQRWSGRPPGALLFESILNVQDPFWGDRLTGGGGAWEPRTVELHNRLVFPLTVAANASDELSLRFEFDPDELDADVMESLLASFVTVLRGFADDPDRPLDAVDVLPAPLRHTLLTGWNRREDSVDTTSTIHGLFQARAARIPEAEALVSGGTTWSYRELDRHSDRLAHRIRSAGIGPGDRVGVAADRGAEMVSALLAVMKAGAAYVPIDPEYPAVRVRLIAEDAGLQLLLAHRHRLPDSEAGPTRRPLPSLDVPMIAVDDLGPEGGEPREAPEVSVTPDAPAYVIYTSGSTGRPKGVVVEHRNVVAFFQGMDEVLGGPAGESWLAVTSISFDISVLELLWTLTRGARVVIHTDRAPRAAGETASPEFSLFFFAAEGAEGEAPPAPGSSRYRLLLEGSRIADAGGLSAVWTPERHFHAFGGIYPNPSVAGAAVAAVTRKVRIRAGSVVLPLHDPVRVAEEWAVVDNLSDGRVDLSFASGWHDRDFVFRPGAYEDRRELMFREIETVRALWRGESVTRKGPKGDVEVTVHPRPVQAELPIRITAGGSPETFRRAGEIGAGLLTHLLGQSPDELEEKIGVYRAAWKEAGHPGRGHVALMVHTYIGTDPEEVVRRVKKPFREYLRTSVGLIRALAEGEGHDLRMAELSEEEMEALLDHAFDRYFRTSALMGTVDSALGTARSLSARGVDEIACLVDFGVEEEATLEGIRRIPELMRRMAEAPAEPAPAPVGEAIRRHGIRHLQCTPSMARLILAEDDPGLENLSTLAIGGEAFPGGLASELRTRLPGSSRLLNMYGPTETTIWSSTHRAGAEDRAETVPIGRPIRGTGLYVVDESGRPVPPGVAGELLIGGHGVARGYHDRPDLTGDRFVASPIPEVDGPLYRTGDRARWRPDGCLEFLGRVDHQVKIRGHRIEPGEIEAVLASHPAVDESVVVVRSPNGSTGTDDARLVAYLTCGEAPPPDGELRRFLLDRLPEVMVPTRFVTLDRFPLTPNAKIDRNRLPAPDSAPDRPEPVRPSNEVERVIAGVWERVLEVPSVGRDDNFFDLGGHSLLTIRVHQLLRGELDAELSITDLFRFPTVRSLAGHLGTGGSDESGLDEARERAATRREALRRRGRGRG